MLTPQMGIARSGVQTHSNARGPIHHPVAKSWSDLRLDPKHVAELQASGITPGVAADRGVCSVHKPEAVIAALEALTVPLTDAGAGTPGDLAGVTRELAPWPMAELACASIAAEFDR